MQYFARKMLVIAVCLAILHQPEISEAFGNRKQCRLKRECERTSQCCEADKEFSQTPKDRDPVGPIVAYTCHMRVTCDRTGATVSASAYERCMDGLSSCQSHTYYAALEDCLLQLEALGCARGENQTRRYSWQAHRERI